MSETNVLNTAWLAELPNAQHDGTTQQICDFASAFQTENARYLAKVATMVQCRQAEDDVWLTVQRDPAAKSLEAADRQQDSYANAARYINLGYTSLPDDEPLKAEAVECERVFRDYKFSTRDPYGAEADKIIQMQQNFQQHETYLTGIGAWQWYLKAVAAAQLVRQCLGARALTMAEFVKGEMKAARRATDLAIADLYTTSCPALSSPPSSPSSKASSCMPANTSSRRAQLRTGATGIMRTAAPPRMVALNRKVELNREAALSKEEPNRVVALNKVEPNRVVAPNRVAERIMKRRTAGLHQKAVDSAGKKKRGIRVVGCPFIVK